jgi:hypothetical protein
MALPTCNEDMNIISKLDDEPNDVGGLSAASLKAKFDLAGNLLKKALNDLVAALGNNAAAKNIGFAPTTAVNKTNVQDAIENVQSQIAGVSQAGIADGAVTAAKIADGAVDTNAIKLGAVDTYRLKDAAVEESKIASGAVTRGKIDYDAVEERNIVDNAVTGDKIAYYTIGSRNIGERAIMTSALVDKAVTTEKIANRAIGSDQIKDGAIGSEKLSSGAVTGQKLAAKCVTKDKVNLKSLVTHVSYSSDGAAGRTINVGGSGILLFIYGNSKYGFVFPWGSVYAAYGTATWQWQDKANLKFENGMLTFVTANAWANEAGHTFVYQML